MKWRYLLVSFGLILIIAISVVFYLSSPFSSDSSLKAFVINQGESVVDISNRLGKNRFIKSPLIFIFWSALSGQKNNIKAGKFEIASSWDVKTIISKLTSGGSTDYWFKIIPGQRLEEFTKDNLVPATSGKEGYLFPDSYLIPEYFTPEEIVAMISKNFDQKIKSLNIKSQDLSEIVTLASLLEREAKTKIDKQKVAAVLINRLKIDMALQVDAAVQYGRDTITKPTKYWLPLSKTDLQIDSPFNTYQNRGLPPSPICNPGLDSLFAAQSPISSENLYYISGHDGLMHFAATLVDHNANIAKYLK